MNAEPPTETLAIARELEDFLQEQAAAAIYFAGADCSVCRVMEPKVRGLLAGTFPRIALGRVATEASPELAARHSVFTVPTLLVFFEGRETFRYARTFSLTEVEADLARPYGLFFD